MWPKIHIISSYDGYTRHSTAWMEIGGQIASPCIIAPTSQRAVELVQAWWNKQNKEEFLFEFLTDLAHVE
jgi:hypothetical protein